MIVGLKKRLRLRWKFEYSDKPSKYGMWDTSGQVPEEQAWFQSKENLTYAVIEGKDVESGRVIRLFGIQGADFCCFEWCATSSMAGLAKPGIGQQLNSVVIGLKIIARDKNIFVYCDGQIKIENRYDQESDKLFHFGRN